jgi:hypothetical protein
MPAKPKSSANKGDPLDREVETLLKDLNLYLTDGDNQNQMHAWLHSRYSGYPDLVHKLAEILPQKVPGAAVPLDNINGWYGYSLTHNKKKLKAAFIAAWREKNNI